MLEWRDRRGGIELPARRFRNGKPRANDKIKSDVWNSGLDQTLQPKTSNQRKRFAPGGTVSLTSMGRLFAGEYDSKPGNAGICFRIDGGKEVP